MRRRKEATPTESKNAPTQYQRRCPACGTCTWTIENTTAEYCSNCGKEIRQK